MQDNFLWICHYEQLLISHIIIWPIVDRKVLASIALNIYSIQDIMVSISIHGEDADWIVCPTVDYFILTSLLTPTPPPPPPPPPLLSFFFVRFKGEKATRIVLPPFYYFFLPPPSHPPPPPPPSTPLWVLFQVEWHNCQTQNKQWRNSLEKFCFIQRKWTWIGFILTGTKTNKVIYSGCYKDFLLSTRVCTFLLLSLFLTECSICQRRSTE